MTPATIMVFVALADARAIVRRPETAYSFPVVIGKPSTPTPTGVFLLQRAYSSRLKMPILIFRREGRTVYAVHPNLPGRAKALNSKTPEDNYLSGGCIGIDETEFEKLYSTKARLFIEIR